MFFNTDGEYYIVKFNDGTYYKGTGLSFYVERTTNDIKEAHRYKFEWEIQKDLYLQQFLYGKDLKCEYIKVNVKTTVELIKD